MVKAKAEKFDAYQVITDQIVAKLESGVAPWRQPWAVNGQRLSPINAISKKAYRGVNWLLLSMLGQSLGYSDSRWLTFKQALELGGCVKKGEKGTQICFWKPVKWTKQNDDGEETTKGGMILRLYVVFNLEQTEGCKIKPLATLAPSPVETNDLAESLVNGMPNPPKITHGSSGASYSPTEDRVKMPDRDTFVSSGLYYLTLFHEIAHSTAHTTRLDRAVQEGGWCAFGSETYGREELVAELGSAFLGAMSGITDLLDHSASYCGNWLGVLKGDKRAIFYAASKAQAASEYIVGAVKAEDSDDS